MKLNRISSLGPRNYWCGLQWSSWEKNMLSRSSFEHMSNVKVLGCWSSVSFVKASEQPMRILNQQIYKQRQRSITSILDSRQHICEKVHFYFFSSVRMKCSENNIMVHSNHSLSSFTFHAYLYMSQHEYVLDTWSPKLAGNCM